MDWLLYSDRYPPLAADVTQVWALTDDVAEQLWATMVDEADQLIHSYREVRTGHRLSRYTSHGPDWYTYANDTKLPDRVVEFLRHAIHWPGEQVVYFAHRRGCVYRLPWEVMLRHWRRFMQLDESWIFGLGRPEFVLFADAGSLLVGDMRWSDGE